MHVVRCDNKQASRPTPTEIATGRPLTHVARPFPRRSFRGKEIPRPNRFPSHLSWCHDGCASANSSHSSAGTRSLFSDGSGLSSLRPTSILSATRWEGVRLLQATHRVASTTHAAYHPPCRAASPKELPPLLHPLGVFFVGGALSVQSTDVRTSLWTSRTNPTNPRTRRIHLTKHSTRLLGDSEKKD